MPTAISSTNHRVQRTVWAELVDENIRTGGCSSNAVSHGAVNSTERPICRRSPRPWRSRTLGLPHDRQVRAFHGRCHDRHRRGSTILLGGFGDVGIPTPLLDGLIEQGARDLTIVAVAGGRDGSAIERLLSLGRVRKLICSFVRPASLSGRLFQSGDLEVEIVPQGTLAERMRAAGAGITGFYTPTGADTLLAEGRETREIGGKLCLLEYPLPGDVALIEAWSADRWGNLTYRDSARNFNPVMAMAAKLTIAMTRNVAALGELAPETIVTPGIFVHRVLHVPL